MGSIFVAVFYNLTYLKKLCIGYLFQIPREYYCCFGNSKKGRVYQILMQVFLFFEKFKAIYCQLQEVRLFVEIRRIVEERMGEGVQFVCVCQELTICLFFNVNTMFRKPFLCRVGRDAGT